MSNRFDFGGVNLRAGEEDSPARPSPEIPFCIAIIGDFSGRASRGISDPISSGELRPHLVDRDNFDEVLSKLHPELHLPSADGSSLVFGFSELEDFHPDRLLQTQTFQQLRALRQRLEDPEHFVAAAEEVGLLPPPSAASAPPAQSVPRPVAPNPARLASGSLLDELIEETESRAPADSRRVDSVHDFARQLSAKYAVSAPDARHSEVFAAVDRAIGDAIRAILHHPQFQALEAIWRSTFLLVRGLDTDSKLRISIVDISKEELAADLNATVDIRQTALYRLFVEKGIQTLGADPWTIVVGAYRFGAEDSDLEILGRLSKVAQAAGAIFVSEANPEFLGCESVVDLAHPRSWKKPLSSDSWSRLRGGSESASVALALPRVLLRLPYGRKTSPLESIEFEEFTAIPVHEEYLWGNPAFIVGLLVGQSFNESNWHMQPGNVAQVDHLPLHVYDGPEGSQSKPCAEVLLTDAGVESILERGLIPMIGFKGRDSVRVGRFQPIADARRPLGGRWERN